MVLKHIIVSYANIYPKEGIMQYKVLKINKILTIINSLIFNTFSEILIVIMKLTPAKINLFLMYKLPAAYFTGVRATYIDDERCEVRVRHRWINQNPFRSMFWAVQGMAAELTTGALVLSKIRESGKSISMLVASNSSTFSKKAVGKIMFQCVDGLKLDEAIEKAIATKEGQSFVMHAKGVNSEGEEVSSFSFEWTIKLKERL